MREKLVIWFHPFASFIRWELGGACIFHLPPIFPLATPRPFPYTTASTAPGRLGPGGKSLIHRVPRDPAQVQGRSGECGRKRLMQADELKTKTPDQLRDSLVALKKEAFNLRFQQATGQLENTSRMRAVRRDVARIKTVLNQKAAAAAAN